MKGNSEDGFLKMESKQMKFKNTRTKYIGYQMNAHRLNTSVITKSFSHRDAKQNLKINCVKEMYLK